VVAVGGADYVQGDILTVTGGTSSAVATFTVVTVDGGGAVLTVAPLAVGNYTALPANPAATTTNSVLGAGATLTVTWEVIAVDVATSGSGYAAAPAVTFAAGVATADAVLTSTSTQVILAHAKVVGSASVLDADIVKQTSTNEYLMTTTDGSSVCSLVASSVPLEGQAYIQALDSLGSTYFVTKLTAHLAVLMQWTDNGGGFLYMDGDEAPWSFDAANNITVQIENI